jgi:type IV secretory pathway TraG/TraD family ATPase VirD4
MAFGVIAVHASQKSKERTLMLCDEIGNLGGMESAAHGDDAAEGRGLTVWSFWQNAAQLQIYGSPELEWLANITNAKTRHAYRVDVAEFIAFTSLKDHSALRSVARSHVIAWHEDMESRSLARTVGGGRRGPSGT